MHKAFLSGACCLRPHSYPSIGRTREDAVCAPMQGCLTLKDSSNLTTEAARGTVLRPAHAEYQASPPNQCTLNTLSTLSTYVLYVSKAWRYLVSSSAPHSRWPSPQPGWRHLLCVTTKEVFFYKMPWGCPSWSTFPAERCARRELVAKFRSTESRIASAGALSSLEKRAANYIFI